MKYYFDTSILVAALLEAHQNHEAAISYLDRATTEDNIFHTSTHTLAELYSVLTRLPGTLKLSPLAAQQIITENII